MPNLGIWRTGGPALAARQCGPSSSSWTPHAAEGIKEHLLLGSLRQMQGKKGEEGSNQPPAEREQRERDGRRQRRRASLPHLGSRSPGPAAPKVDS